MAVSVTKWFDVGGFKGWKVFVPESQHICDYMNRSRLFGNFLE